MVGRLKAVFHVNHLAHQQHHGEAMRDGLARHGIKTEFAKADRPAGGDFCVIWGWKQARVIGAAKAAGRPVLVMERGHLPDRMQWTSCGWGGLGNRATYPNPGDDGERWGMNWGGLLKPWRDAHNGHALLLGQVPGDAALYGLPATFNEWAQATVDALRRAGWLRVVFRPHPLTVRTNIVRCPVGATLSTNAALDDDLAGAALAVGYNSTATVETVLAGVPTVTLDPAGSMAAPVTMHAIPEYGRPLARPSRQEWAHRLAWCQFSVEEIRSGFAWECLRP